MKGLHDSGRGTENVWDGSAHVTSIVYDEVCAVDDALIMARAAQDRAMRSMHTAHSVPWRVIVMNMQWANADLRKNMKNKSRNSCGFFLSLRRRRADARHSAVRGEGNVMSGVAVDGCILKQRDCQ